MKKIYIALAIASLSLAMSSCGNDDTPDSPEDEFAGMQKDVFVLNQGNEGNNIEGSLNIIDYADQSYARNVFKTVNKRSLGGTPQCGIAYGSKLYIGMSQSNTIEIIDRKTCESIKQLRLEDSKDGQKPRSMVATKGKVYISMYDGYVARLDTLSMMIDASVKVGPNPETIALKGNMIYVPNSDGANYPDFGTTASAVSVEPFKEVERFDVPLNPAMFLSNGDRLYLLCRGNYNDIAESIYEIKADNSYVKVADATKASIKGNTLYLMNYPYGGTPEFSRYDIPSATFTKMNFEGIKSPSNMEVDPLTGNIVISSYPEGGGLEIYSLPGSVAYFKNDGTLIKSFDGGVGEACIFFNYK